MYHNGALEIRASHFLLLFLHSSQFRMVVLSKCESGNLSPPIFILIVSIATYVQHKLTNNRRQPAPLLLPMLLPNPQSNEFVSIVVVDYDYLLLFFPFNIIHLIPTSVFFQGGISSSPSEDTTWFNPSRFCFN